MCVLLFVGPWYLGADHLSSPFELVMLLLQSFAVESLLHGSESVLNYLHSTCTGILWSLIWQMAASMRAGARSRMHFQHEFASPSSQVRRSLLHRRSLLRSTLPVRMLWQYKR